jgi:hypothetical protein
MLLIDIEGEYASLRETMDAVLVGPDGDIPTDLRSAELLARKLVELRVSAIINIYDLKIHERREYVRRFLDSLNAFAELPGDTLILPSHGLPFVGAGARTGQLREHHAARLEELAAAAATPKTASDIVPVLFRRELDLQQRFFAMGEAIAHLNHLWHGGLLDRSIDDDGTIRFVRAAGIQ